MGVPASIGVSASGKSPYLKDKANGVVQGVLSAVGPGKPFSFYGSMNLLIWGSYATALTTTAGSLNASVAAIGALAPGNAVNSVNVPPGTTVKTTGVGGANNVALALPTITLFARAMAGSNRLTNLGSTNYLLGATVSGPGVPANTTVTAIVVPATPDNPAGPGKFGIVTLSNNITLDPQNTLPVPFEFALAAQAITVTGADAAASFTGAEILYAGTAQLERSPDGGNTWLLCNVGGGGQLAQWSAGTTVSVSFGEPEREMLYRVNAPVLTSGAINYRLSATGQAATSLSIPDTL